MSSAEKSARWRTAHPERAVEVKRRYNDSHRERRAEDALRYAETHREERIKYRRRYAEANPGVIAETRRRFLAAHPGYYRAHHLMRAHGITQAQYDAMLAAQGGVCAICHKSETHARGGKVLPLVVDHNHDTGAVRALLCYVCNFAIGLLYDDPHLLASASAYIEVHA